MFLIVVYDEQQEYKMSPAMKIHHVMATFMFLILTFAYYSFGSYTSEVKRTITHKTHQVIGKHCAN